MADLPGASPRMIASATCKLDPLGLIQPCRIANPHRQHARTQVKIPRLANGQIRRIGYGHEKLDSPDTLLTHGAAP